MLRRVVMLENKNVAAPKISGFYLPDALDDGDRCRALRRRRNKRIAMNARRRRALIQANDESVATIASANSLPKVEISAQIRKLRPRAASSTRIEVEANMRDRED